MKAIAYNIQPDEKEWLVRANYKKHDITIIANRLCLDTLPFSKGKEALLIFNNDALHKDLILGLRQLGIKYIATSTVETQQLDLEAAGLAGIKVANVPLDDKEVNSKNRMEQVIKNLDLWAAGTCLGMACCCHRACESDKTLK